MDALLAIFKFLLEILIFFFFNKSTSFKKWIGSITTPLPIMHNLFLIKPDGRMLNINFSLPR